MTMSRAQTEMEEIEKKIDDVSAKLDLHIEQHAKDMDELKPFIQAKAGGTILFKFLVGIGALAMAYVAFKNAIFGTSIPGAEHLLQNKP